MENIYHGIYCEIVGMKTIKYDPSYPSTNISCWKLFVSVKNSRTIKQLMLLYCNTEDCAWLQVRMQLCYICASPGLTSSPSSVWLYEQQCSLLSSKSVVPQVHRASVESSPKDPDGAVQILLSSLITDGRKLLLYESLDINHFLQRLEIK